MSNIAANFLRLSFFLFSSLNSTYYVHSEEIPSADIYIFIVIILSTIYLHSFFTLLQDLRGYFYIIESHEYQIHFAISTSLLYGNAREKMLLAQCDPILRRKCSLSLKKTTLLGQKIREKKSWIEQLCIFSSLHFYPTPITIFRVLIIASQSY